MLKLDDIFVYTKQRWDEMSGVEAVEFAPATVSTEIYNISGIRLDQLTPGINIVRTTDANGRTQTRKIIVK